MTVDEKVRSKEQQILQAALDTICEEKIAGTRLREIARRAGISQGHLHYYFSSKDELLLESLELLLQEFVEARSQSLENSEAEPALKLRLFLEQKKEIILERAEIDIATMDFWIHSTQDPEWQNRFRNWYRAWRHDIETVVHQGVRSGVFSAAHAHMIPSLLVSLMEGAALQYHIDHEALDLDEYFSTAIDLVLDFLKISQSVEED